MWFGTLDGLDRYDGVEIRSYTEKFPGDQQQVNCIINDTQNGLWVGAEGGLLYWDYISPEFRLIPISDNEINVTTLISLPNDSLLLAAGSQSLFLVDTRTFKHSRIALNSPDFDNIGGIVDGFYDGDNFVWLLASTGLLKLNLEDYSIQTFKNDTQDSSRSNFSCFTFFKGDILVGTFLEGIFLFNVEEKRFYPFEEVENRFIMSLKFQSDNETLYVGTDGDGLIVLNTQNGNLTTFAKDYSNPYSLNSNAIYSMLIDEDNRYWLGTYSGGVNFNVGKGDFFDVTIETDGIFLGDKSIRSIFFDGKGNQFIGTRDGLFVFRKDGSSQSFNSRNDDFLNSDVILSLKLYKGNLLVGTFRGGYSLYYILKV
jgi:ligand-binding sensor domain-containing protein